MKRWIGRSIMGVSVGHTLFAVAVFNQQLTSIVQRGFFNTIGDAKTGLAVWFVLFGAILCLLGMAVDTLEQRSADPMPKSLGWGVLALTAVGVCLMPASGFWLVFPAAIAMLVRKSPAPAVAAARA
ncbi:MAG: DUF6463 family protein [Pseudomonadota bacterium]